MGKCTMSSVRVRSGTGEVSNDITTTAVVSEVAGGNTAFLLGIGGGNVFTALDVLRDALQRDDTDGILASFANLNEALDTVLQARSEYGASVRTLDTLEIGHDADEVSATELFNAITKLRVVPSD